MGACPGTAGCKALDTHLLVRRKEYEQLICSVVCFLHEDGQVLSGRGVSKACLEVVWSHQDMLVRDDVAALSEHLQTCLPDAVETRRLRVKTANCSIHYYNIQISITI